MEKKMENEMETAIYRVKVCRIMEKKMETTRFRGYIGFRV